MCGFELQTPWRFIPKELKGRRIPLDLQRKSCLRTGRDPVSSGDTVSAGWAPGVSTMSSLGPRGLCCVPGPITLDRHSPALTRFMDQRN